MKGTGGRPTAFVINWNKPEALERVRLLRKQGWTVRYEHADGARGGGAIKANPPDVIVIYLSRLPSHGRETAHALKSMKPTRAIPIVFVDGEPDKIAKVKAVVPDAVYTTSGNLRKALEPFKR